jgi:cytochrome c
MTTEALPDEECLEFHTGHCEAGTTQYRMPLSGTGRSFPRCDLHWEKRLEEQDRINERYPDSPLPPSDFDPSFAGERWDDDY